MPDRRDFLGAVSGVAAAGLVAALHGVRLHFHETLDDPRYLPRDGCNDFIVCRDAAFELMESVAKERTIEPWVPVCEKIVPIAHFQMHAFLRLADWSGRGWLAWAVDITESEWDLPISQVRDWLRDRRDQALEELESLHTGAFGISADKAGNLVVYKPISDG